MTCADPGGRDPPPLRECAQEMRVMLVLYSVFIVAGLVLYSVVGLAHH